MRLGLHRRPLGSHCVLSLYIGLLVGLLSTLCLAPSITTAADIDKTSDCDAGVVRVHKSPHFAMQTDLSTEDARELLKQMEIMLKLISNYWGRPPVGVIECYIVKDLSNWSEQQQKTLAGPGLDSIRKGLGVSIGMSRSNGKRIVHKAKVYGVAHGGVPLHEAVHGYCQQTFGNTGPLWYAEGMAELGRFWIHGSRGVNASPTMINYLRNCPRRPLDEMIVNKKTLGGSGTDYAWWWLLSHLLENNCNYRTQFRALGRDILAGKDTTFHQVFGAKIKELEFELDFFRDHLETGFRVDACSWDWKREFRGEPVSVAVRANRGWQASGLTLKAGSEYGFTARGMWRLGAEAQPLSASGAADGQGRLVGVVMKGYKLGEEFELGRSGTFQAPSDGDLYLRCRVPWSKIADNADRIVVDITGNPTYRGVAVRP